MIPLDRTFTRYRAVLCGSTGLMIGLSWPLWLNDSNFPRIPFFARFPILPGWLSMVLLAGILLSLAMAMVGVGGRRLVAVSLALLAVSVIQDQNRFQPWVYQFLVIGLALACVGTSRALGMARWYTIGLYVYSGFSKLDASFCRELGPIFLASSLRPLGISPEAWPEGLRTVAVLAMPGFEIGVGIMLALPKTRKWGLVGSVLLHGSLVEILGPWNLGHSTNVLIWNVAQIFENLVLFGSREIPVEREPDSKAGPLAWLVFAVAMGLPVGERLGWCDAWPAHALYASHAERSEIYLHEDDLDQFPEPIKKRIGPANASPWRRLDLTGWSLDVHGTPTYPSGRVGNAVAEFLQNHYGGVQPVRLVQWSRASVQDGRRQRDESLGLKAIRRRGEQFWLNAHPGF